MVGENYVYIVNTFADEMSTIKLLCSICRNTGL